MRVQSSFEKKFRFTDMSPKGDTSEKSETKKLMKVNKKAKKALKKSMQKYINYATSKRGLSQDSSIHPIYYNEIPSNETIFIEWSDGEISNFRKFCVKIMW